MQQKKIHFFRITLIHVIYGHSTLPFEFSLVLEIIEYQKFQLLTPRKKTNSSRLDTWRQILGSKCCPILLNDGSFFSPECQLLTFKLTGHVQAFSVASQPLPGAMSQLQGDHRPLFRAADETVNVEPDSFWKHGVITGQVAYKKHYNTWCLWAFVFEWQLEEEKRKNSK